MAEQEYIYEYELIAITFELNYKLSEDNVIWRVGEDEPLDNHEHTTIEYDADGIPKGKSKQEIKIREKIRFIRHFE